MKKIGVLGGLQGTVFGITIPYYEFASSFGEVVLINPLSKNINKDLDLLILVGGADKNPLSYNEVPSLRTNKPNPVREWFDENVLPEYIENKTPIFGICLGLQSLIVHFGGKLIQHNSSIHPFSGSVRDNLVHEMIVNNKSIDIFSKFKRAYLHFIHEINWKEVKINSLHHQAGDNNALGDGLVSLFNTKDYDGTPEIIVHKELPIVAFQFHPEEITEDKEARILANKFIESLLYDIR
jgi:putative glutamine amidotransferase